MLQSSLIAGLEAILKVLSIVLSFSIVYYKQELNGINNRYYRG